MKKIQVLAIISGIATFFLVLTMSKNAEKPVVEEVVREQIVVAAADIIPYTEITANMLSIKEVEVESIHQSTIRDMDEVIGRISKTTIFANEPILSVKIDEKESLAAGLALQVAPGKRAISIIVGNDTGVANNLRAGNWVDMLAILPSDLPEDVLAKYNSWAARYPEYFTFLANSSAQSSEGSKQGNEVVGFSSQTVIKSVILLQDVKVLALDKNFLSDYNTARNMETYTSVTLEVTPEQALMINLAEEYHNVRLILRGQTDHEIMEIEGITMQDLMLMMQAMQKEEGEE